MEASAAAPRSQLASVALVAGWAVGGVLAGIAIDCIAWLLGIVDPYTWGKLVGNLVRLTVTAMVISGVLFLKNQRGTAYMVTGVTLGLHSGLLGLAIVVAVIREALF